MNEDAWLGMQMYVSVWLAWQQGRGGHESLTSTPMRDCHALAITKLSVGRAASPEACLAEPCNFL